MVHDTARRVMITSVMITICIVKRTKQSKQRRKVAKGSEENALTPMEGGGISSRDATEAELHPHALLECFWNVDRAIALAHGAIGIASPRMRKVRNAAACPSDPASGCGVGLLIEEAVIYTSLERIPEGAGCS